MQPPVLLAQAGLPTETPYVVVANLPYNAGAAVLRHFLEADRPPRRLVVMLQREVAEAITAAPGSLSILGVATQVYAEAKRLFNVAPGAFQPPPKVTSTVIRLDVRPQPLVSPDERERFFRVLHAGFSAPRKQLRNALAQGLDCEPGDVVPAIEAAGLEPTVRPQDVSIDGWLRLARALG
jgi:16S rRNA (adenine1518-N6/adenine1519-N6)-dimethyltransferase